MGDGWREGVIGGGIFWREVVKYTPSFLVYKARWNMTRSSKRYFDQLFVIYYITYDYKFIIIVNYI